MLVRLTTAATFKYMTDSHQQEITTRMGCGRSNVRANSKLHIAPAARVRQSRAAISYGAGLGHGFNVVDFWRFVRVFRRISS